MQYIHEKFNTNPCCRLGVIGEPSDIWAYWRDLAPLRQVSTLFLGGSDDSARTLATTCSASSSNAGLLLFLSRRRK